MNLANHSKSFVMLILCKESYLGILMQRLSGFTIGAFGSVMLRFALGKHKIKYVQQLRSYTEEFMYQGRLFLAVQSTFNRPTHICFAVMFPLSSPLTSCQSFHMLISFSFSYRMCLMRH